MRVWIDGEWVGAMVMHYVFPVYTPSDRKRVSDDLVQFDTKFIEVTNNFSNQREYIGTDPQPL
jgi:hypothetical protein